jgi:hypothetical protein
MDITIFRENRAEDLRKNGVVLPKSIIQEMMEDIGKPTIDKG